MTSPLPKLTRRTLLVLASAPFAGCGGGDLTTVSLPGTTGTGIVALASITGFGSVIVGGQTYDETTANILIDGEVASRSDLRLGMTAYVTGTWLDDTNAGVAQQIDVLRCASGTLRTVSADRCELHGTTFVWDEDTLWDGTSKSTLQTGQAVVLWGLQANADATLWRLTRVTAGDGGTPTVTGVLTQHDGNWRINGLQLLGVPQAIQNAGQLVWIRGTPVNVQGTVWQVSSAQLARGVAGTGPSGRVHLEGVVTGNTADGRLIVGGQTVDVSTLTAPPSIGQRIQLDAQAGADGLLRVKSIELTGHNTTSPTAARPLTRLSGKVDNWIDLTNFTVQGQRCNASEATGHIGALMAGDWVTLKGVRVGQVLNVVEISLTTDTRNRIN